MKHLKFISLFLLLPVFSFAQKTDSLKTDTAQVLHEVVITGFQPNAAKFTSINIEAYSLQQMNEKAPYNLSDALAKLPGISQINTGNSISKPVIRGLYGNRILVLLSGNRFDNQQWQDEHGLGLSQIGIDRVEVIKGPASLLYGSDALGGVINVIEEKPTLAGKKFDFSTQLSSNTLGSLTDAGFSRKKNNQWQRIRVGYESHADYTDGNNHRVNNSRNTGYYLKAGFGFQKKKWVQENSYNFSYNNFGFIMDDLNTFFVPGDRYTRAMSGPHHIVMLNLLNTQNTFYLKKSTLKLNAGFQSNSRREDEGGGSISLNMHLMSFLQNLRWEKELKKNISFVLNQQLTFENNTNYGGRKIIPDANMLETNVSGYFKFYFQKLIIETGVGGNYKNITTFVTPPINNEGEHIQPFNKTFTTGNGMLGFSYNPKNWVTLKANTASGFRAPNLAELSSNGVHEGVYRYEVGDPNMKVEKNINSDLSVEINRKQIFFSASAFYNYFLDYVYLAPTSEKKYGFNYFYYKQQNAKLYGGEALLSIKPTVLKYWQWNTGFTYTEGLLADGGHLPFIPAYKLNSDVRFEKNCKGKISSIFIEPEWIYVFAQNQPAQFETSTGDYYLINLSSGIRLHANSGDWKIGVTVTNLTNNAYADHLSRLKYYGLYNEGINFVLSIRKEIKW